VRVRETFYRGKELARVHRTMPAQTYHLTRLLLARSRDTFVFVPIRSMQYLGIIEAGELNFVHSEARREIDISWQSLTADERSALDQPVSYEAVYYTDEAPVTMQRLQGDLLRALELMASRSAPADTGVVLALRRHRRAGMTPFY
jgi:hypothetical protein